MKKILRFFVDFINGKKNYEKLEKEFKELYFFLKEENRELRERHLYSTNKDIDWGIEIGCFHIRRVMGKFQEVKNLYGCGIIEDHHRRRYEDQIPNIKMKVNLDALCEPDNVGMEYFNKT